MIALIAKPPTPRTATIARLRMGPGVSFPLEMNIKFSTHSLNLLTIKRISAILTVESEREMSKHITNAKGIQSKSRSHQVEQIARNIFTVTSGTSGSRYTVTIRDSGAHCTCEWGKYRPGSDNHRSGCSHVTAVYNWIAEQDGRRVSVWTDETQATRQHRPMCGIGDNVTLTSRKVTA